MGKTTTKKSKVKKILKRELVSNRKYKTTYKDINKYFKIINKAVFNNILAPFNDVQIKKIYKDETKKSCYGQVVVWEWKRKGTGLMSAEDFDLLARGQNIPKLPDPDLTKVENGKYYVPGEKTIVTIRDFQLVDQQAYN